MCLFEGPPTCKQITRTYARAHAKHVRIHTRTYALAYARVRANRCAHTRAHTAHAHAHVRTRSHTFAHANTHTNKHTHATECIKTYLTWMARLAVQLIVMRQCWEPLEVLVCSLDRRAVGNKPTAEEDLPRDNAMQEFTAGVETHTQSWETVFDLERSRDQSIDQDRERGWLIDSILVKALLQIYSMMQQAKPEQRSFTVK